MYRRTDSKDVMGKEKKKAYSLDDFMHEGLSAKFNGKYDLKQLEKGIAVEYEHTTNKDIAEKIAKDHLAEHPRYYDYLAAAEEAMTKNEGK